MVVVEGHEICGRCKLAVKSTSESVGMSPGDHAPL